MNFDVIWSWPKPVQRPHPPVLVGSDGPRGIQRVVRYGDEWFPRARGVDSFEDKIKELNDLAARAGRGPISVSVFGVPPDPARLEQYRLDGVTRCLFALPSAGADVVLPKLDELAELIV